MGFLSMIKGGQVTPNTSASADLLHWSSECINPENLSNIEFTNHHSAPTIKKPTGAEVTLAQAQEAELFAKKVEQTASHWEKVCKAREKVAIADTKIRKATNEVIKVQADNCVEQFNSNAQAVAYIGALQPSIAKTLSMTTHAINLAQQSTDMIGDRRQKVFG